MTNNTGQFRINFSSHSPWEDVVGYSRAVKTGNIIEVSGTTASPDDSGNLPNDYYLQTRNILLRIEQCLKEAGASMKDVTRTRMYVRDISKWKEVARAHHEFFSGIKPAATMVEVSNLIDPKLLVEIEATAVRNE